MVEEEGRMVGEGRKDGGRRVESGIRERLRVEVDERGFDGGA